MTGHTGPRLRVGIVGAGRAGCALGRALQLHGGVQVVLAHSRGEAGREHAATQLGVDVVADPADVMRAELDVVLVGVPDDEVAPVAAALADTAGSPRTVLLLSGSVPLAALAPLGVAGHALARLQPLHPCGPDTSPELLRGSVATIGGDDTIAIDVARFVAHAAGLRPVEVAEDALPAWHAAATIASNHLVTRIARARELAERAGIDEDTALDALGTSAVAAAVATTRHTPEVALTGPVSRGDASTLARHAAAIRELAPDQVASWRREVLDTVALAGRAGRIDRDAERRLRRAIAAPGPGVTCVGSVGELRAALAGARAAGLRVGFVPTMGALHDGHAQLVRDARAACDLVVVSCFVNPTQFAPGEDLDRYPRTPEADARIVADAGGDVLWRPTVADVYGDDPDAATRIRVGAIGDVLEGASRPGHFDGVASVVVRLLGAVAPDVLYLGAKDFQQVAVLRRVVADLAIDVELCVAAIVRDVDGLALSSRNAYLAPDERTAALAVPRALDAAARAVAAGERDVAAVRAAALEVLDAEPLLQIDHVELRDPHTLAPCTTLDAPVVLLVAVHVGSTRLIDNALLAAAPTAGVVDLPERSKAVPA